MKKVVFNQKHLIWLLVVMIFVGLVSTVFGVKKFNGWDIGFESDYYEAYITSQDQNTIPVEIDFTQRVHTFEFFLDNINELSRPNYMGISQGENDSKVTIHIVGADNGLVTIISPEEYDPRVPYTVDYNNKRRVVIKFEMPSKFTDSSIFEIGLRAKTLQSENRQIILNLMKEYPKAEKEFDYTLLIVVIVFVIFGILFIWFFFLRRNSGVSKNDY